MAIFYLFVFGAYLYYCKSKYFPAGIYKFPASWSSWLGLALFATGTALYVSSEGWASGMLLALCAVTVALMLIQFAAILGKWYFYGLVILTHGLALIDLVS